MFQLSLFLFFKAYFKSFISLKLISNKFFKDFFELLTYKLILLIKIYFSHYDL